jgi:16S rRNA (cytosine967-C5)-methyltransferase
LGDSRDRALAADIATGTLRWQAMLDYVIAHVSRRDIDRLDPAVRDILRLSAYQLLKLDRIPASAAVNDAVELTRGAGKQSATSFVNAVLRKIAREGDRVPLPAPPARGSGTPGGPDLRQAALDYLAIAMSHPRWLVRRWLDRYGFDAAARWAAFNNAPAPITLRANRLKATTLEVQARLERLGVELEPTRFAPNGLVVTGGHPLATPLADQGLFIVQEEASQLVIELVGARAGERILDACASPGIKTTALAALVGAEGQLVATDLRQRRVMLLRRTLNHYGADKVAVVRCDVRAALPFRTGFDAVLLDAPCSGLGTIRRDPEIRWRRTEADLERFAATQRAMLEHASEVVRPGGRLVYATCSSEPEENDDVVNWFLTRHPEFTPAPLEMLSRTVTPALAGVLDQGGALRTLPHVHGVEAFFAALLVRRC